MTSINTVNRALTVIVGIGAGLFILFFAQVMWWAADRDSPFVMLDYTAPAAKPGETTTIRAVVRRDLTRRCSVLYSRSFFDSKNVRSELTDGAQLMNSTALEELNRRSPQSLAFDLKIPAKAAPGWGTVMTVLDYQCNPMHQIYPIPVVLIMNVEVL